MLLSVSCPAMDRVSLALAVVLALASLLIVTITERP
jgi:hypothetical protein